MQIWYQFQLRNKQASLAPKAGYNMSSSHRLFREFIGFLFVPTMCPADFFLCLSVLGSAGLTDRVSQSADEKALRRSAGRSNQQTHAAHQRQTAAPQNLRRAVEPAEAGAQQGV